MEPGYGGPGRSDRERGKSSENYLQEINQLQGAHHQPHLIGNNLQGLAKVFGVVWYCEYHTFIKGVWSVLLCGWVWTGVKCHWWSEKVCCHVLTVWDSLVNCSVSAGPGWSSGAPGGRAGGTSRHQSVELLGSDQHCDTTNTSTGLGRGGERRGWQYH